MAKQKLNNRITDKTDKKKYHSNEQTVEYIAGPCRPLEHDEPSKEITVSFGESRFAEINDVCSDILKKHDGRISMSGLIRGITKAVLDSDIDLTDPSNEQEINKLVSNAIDRGKYVIT